MLILEILIYALVNCGFSDFASLEIPLIILVINNKKEQKNSHIFQGCESFLLSI